MGYTLTSSTIYPLIAFLLLVSLFISLSILSNWSTIVLSLISILLFLGLFALDYAMCTVHLSFNEWIYEVENMSFLFNRSFMTWLFARHRKAWVQWQAVINLILAIPSGVAVTVLVSPRITQASLFTGFLFSIPIVGLFSLVFYKLYTSRLETSL